MGIVYIIYITFSHLKNVINHTSSEKIITKYIIIISVMYYM